MNNITEWSYEKPTEPGLYLCCYGDVETHSNISFVKFEMEYGTLYGQHGEAAWSYSKSCKWARLLVGSEVDE